MEAVGGPQTSPRRRVQLRKGPARQIAAVSHGGPAALFRGVNILNTGVGGRPVSASLSPQETSSGRSHCPSGRLCRDCQRAQRITNLRWQTTRCTTNGAMRSRTLTVISVVKRKCRRGVRSGVIARSAVTADDIEPLVRASEQAARSAGPADDAAPLVEPSGDHAELGCAARRDVRTGIGDFAPALGDRLPRRRRPTAAFGFAEHVVETTYLGSSTGLRLRHEQRPARSSSTARRSSGRSVWAGVGDPHFSDVDVSALDAEIAAGSTGRSAASTFRPVATRRCCRRPPSRFDALHVLVIDRARRPGRTVFSKKGGGTRIGEQLATIPVSLHSDPAAPGLQSAPFLAASSTNSAWSIFDNGMPIGRSTGSATGC